MSDSELELLIKEEDKLEKSACYSNCEIHDLSIDEVLYLPELINKINYDSSKKL